MKRKLILLAVEERTPPREFRLFTWGVNDTSKGKFVLTRTSAAEVMARHREHGVDLMLDYEHHSLDPNATPEQKKASGWGDLQVRDDGLWLTNIRWTPQAAEYLKAAEFRYLSPAFNVDDENQVIELINVALTNLPATHNQEALVAASQGASAMKKKMSEHLKEHASKHGGHEALAKHLGMDAGKLAKHMGGEPMTHEEMKACASKLGIEHHLVTDFGEEAGGDLETAPIDTSYNGTDVNKSIGSPGDHLSALFETAMGDEAVVPHTKDEAPENQGGMMKMSRAAAEALVADRKKLVELRAEIDHSLRSNLIEASKKKLNPTLIALSRKIATKDLKDFLAALPDQPELHEPQVHTLSNGGTRMVTLTREDKEVATLSGKSETEFAKIKEELGMPESLIMLAGQRAYEGRKPEPAADKAERTTWDRRYIDTFVSLSMMDRTPDGKRWKPAHGSKFVPASKIED